MRYITSLYCVTTPLHVSGPFVAHQQEAECITWPNNTCLLTSRLLAGLDIRLRSKQVSSATSYTGPPDDGPQTDPKYVEGVLSFP
jgi:hypothetical protein